MITANSILRDLEAFTYSRVRVQHSEKLALACARALFDCLYMHFMRQCLYIPTSDKAGLHETYAAIWNDFNGRNHAELSVRYHVSVQHIYAVIKQMRQNNIRQRQHDLFPLPDEKPKKPLVRIVLEDYLPADLQRAGLPMDESNDLAQQIADHLCETYPGVQIRITESHRAQRQRHEGDLFDMDEAEAI